MLCSKLKQHYPFEYEKVTHQKLISIPLSLSLRLSIYLSLSLSLSLYQKHLRSSATNFQSKPFIQPPTTVPVTDKSFNKMQHSIKSTDLPRPDLQTVGAGGVSPLFYLLLHVTPLLNWGLCFVPPAIPCHPLPSPAIPCHPLPCLTLLRHAILPSFQLSFPSKPRCPYDHHPF